jgi:hypothetical protein
LEVIGVLAIIAGLGWLALWAIFRPFKNFAGGDCADTEERIVTSPNGNHTIKSFHRVCGVNGEKLFSGYFVYLSTGNPNVGYEYTPIVELKNVAPNQTSVSWDNPEQISVTYPSSAEVVDAYAKTFGVNVLLHPAQPAITSDTK